MATIIEQAPQIPSRPETPPSHLTLNTTVRGTPAPIPNKHIPVCSPGRGPSNDLNTPPSSPPSKNASLQLISSVLNPESGYTKLIAEPSVYKIDASKIAEALEQAATKPLPDPRAVFPWLHGLHAENSLQLAFFVSRRKYLRRVPQALRGITIVKAGGNLERAKLKGAIAAEEILHPNSFRRPASESRFLEIDPKDGFSVRNFQIQTCKLATMSDIIVYGDDDTSKEEVRILAKRIACAQRAWKVHVESLGWDCGTFSTFAMTDSFQALEQEYPDIVAINSKGHATGKVHDFFSTERYEMAHMTRPSEIAPNVFMGPTPDHSIIAPQPDDPSFDVFVEASDLAQIPENKTLNGLRNALEAPERPTVHFEVPGSGSIMPPNWSHAEVDGLLRICKWIYKVSRGIPDDSDSDVHDKMADSAMSLDRDGDVEMAAAPAVQPSLEQRKVLIHCPDGYTESTLIGLTYFMYAHGLTVAEAWVAMHKQYGRNFFAYHTDVTLLTSIQARILSESPARADKAVAAGGSLSEILPADPEWLGKLDGSIPSRILPYMYLGNLNHANNVGLLKELGIRRIVSVGEKVSWIENPLGSPLSVKNETVEDIEVLNVENVQDNGVDSLSAEFERCLEFIEQGKTDGIATLVHCRVGVSRSATICIAEVMKELNLTFPRAYCFVRARRLNVIIQPHLRFTYELLKWEEELRVRRGEPLRRELEWATVAREIAAMNRPYSRG